MQPVLYWAGFESIRAGLKSELRKFSSGAAGTRTLGGSYWAQAQPTLQTP